jgi:hypothetical protein
MKSKVCIVVIIIDIQIIVPNALMCMPMIHLSTKFHMPSHDGSLIMIIKLKAKCFACYYLNATRKFLCGIFYEDPLRSIISAP